jgi:hypothetical protein
MRLVTRGDLDGLTCAVLITHCERIEEILLVHPQDVTDKKFRAAEDDILANLPYQAGCGKWFDHHLLTESNESPPENFDGRYALAPSAARVVYEYYVGQKPLLQRYETLLAETDRLDAALLEMEDVLDPKAYILLAYTLDPRTGLGAYREYFLMLVNALQTKPIEAVMQLPEVQERVRKIREQDRHFRDVTQQKSRLDGNVVLMTSATSTRSRSAIAFSSHAPLANVSVRSTRPNREYVAAPWPLDLQPHLSHQGGRADVRLRGGGHQRRHVPAARGRGRAQARGDRGAPQEERLNAHESLRLSGDLPVPPPLRQPIDDS